MEHQRAFAAEAQELRTRLARGTGTAASTGDARTARWPEHGPSRPDHPADGVTRRAASTYSAWSPQRTAGSHRRVHAAGPRRCPGGRGAVRRGHLLPQAGAAQDVHPAVRRTAGGRRDRDVSRPSRARRFRRTDGCEIARWRAMAPLLGGTPGSPADLSIRPQRNVPDQQERPGAVGHRDVL